MRENSKLLRRRDLRNLRLGLLSLVLLSAAGMYQFRTLIYEENWDQVSAKLCSAEVLGWASLCILVVLGFWIGKTWSDHVLKWITTAYNSPGGLKAASFVLIMILIPIYPVMMFGEYSPFFTGYWIRQAIFVWLVVFTSIAMAVWRHKSWLEMLPYSALVLAVSYHFASYLPGISNYPFALGWSETTRYYIASTLFDKQIYGIDLPLPFRDFSRYLMQAVPFIIQDSPLWVHRLWQAALRFGLTYVAGYVIAHRYKIKDSERIALFTMWAGLYFFQGPVFYNLLVIVILVFWLLKTDPFWKALVFVVGISVWAGLSRVNWIPMPGLMAAAFYLLEKPISGGKFKELFRNLWKPVVFVSIGTIVGLLVYQGYAVISGNPEEIYYSSFSSYLLWDRLLPNPSYKLGILPHILLITGPLLVYVGLTMDAWKNRWYVIRPLGLVVIMGGLFYGGLLVSVKIGGGTNLHNMDVYLVILLLITAEVFFGVTVDDEGIPIENRMPDWLKVLVFVIPILFVISYGGSRVQARDMIQAQRDLDILQEFVDKAVDGGGEVIFISQRHLVTFGYIENVPLVHDHEKLLLQEMAMSRNRQYLENFGKELAEQRYGLVVYDRLPIMVRDEETVPLAAENNVVLYSISPLVGCAYQEHTRLSNGELVLFVPAEKVTCGNVEEGT